MKFPKKSMTMHIGCRGVQKSAKGLVVIESNWVSEYEIG